MGKILDGKILAKNFEAVMIDVIKKAGIHPKLAIISCGDDDASAVYMRNKVNAAKRIGIEYIRACLKESACTEDVIETVNMFNNDDTYHGIIVQLPLPTHIDTKLVQKSILPKKDVDGFGRDSLFNPCTPFACLRILDSENLTINGMHCVVIGRSEIVGKPLARMLEERNATVSLCHSKTPPNLLKTLCQSADFIFCAAGRRDLVQADYIKEGCVLVDISINRNEEGKLCGDASTDCYEKCSYYTPVPGGVGPMTVNTLMWNTVSACLIHENNSLDSF